MRNFEEVITQIIDILVLNGCGNSRLATNLRRVKNDSGYTAPELMYLRWNEVYDLLCDNFLNENGKIDKETILLDMKVDILSVFSMRDREEIRRTCVE